MTNKKITDEEIIKVLECCAYSDGCERCQYSKQCDGAEHLINALDLINRQKSGIEELKNYVNRCKSGKEYWVKCLLEKPNEAIKEFAERIKMSIKENVDEAWHRDDGKGIYDAEYVLEDIDNLLKEMVGEE